MVRYRISRQYPGYRVGDDGSVWCRINRGRYGGFRQWRKLKTCIVGKRGKRIPQQLAWFRNDKGQKPFAVGRLVLSAFIGPCPRGMECCHENGNPLDNRLTNLRWDTHKNNEKDKIRHGTLLRGEQSHMAKLTEKDVVQIRERRRSGETLKAIAADYGVRLTTVHAAVSGQTWGWLK